MSKTRKVKMLSIVALVLAIISMSLGLAAFSATLNISSSASVSPNSKDFNIKVYGFETEDDLFSFFESIEKGNDINESYLSEDSSLAFCNNDSMSGTMAAIDNSSLTISNMNISFSAPSSDTVQYFFVITNDGKYDAYFDEEEFNNQTFESYSCDIIGEGSQNNQFVCDFVGVRSNFMSSSMKEISDIIIPVGDFIFMELEWQYTDIYVDTPIIVRYSGIKFPLTTKLQS